MNKSISRIKEIVLYLILIFVSFCMIIPFLWMLSTALKQDQYVLRIPPQLIPETPVLTSFRDLFRLFPMFHMAGNSIFVAITVTTGQIITSAMAAYAFARIKFRGHQVVFMLYLATMMVPFQVTMTPLFILMKNFGWINHYLGLIVPNLHSAFGTFQLRQAFLTIPKDLEESAFMDGAGHFVVFSRIILPLVKPALATLFVLAFMGSWNSFLWPLIITRSEFMMTIPVGLASLHGRFQTRWNMVMAGSVISILPILIVFLLSQRYFVQGIARTGIKV